TPHSALTPKPRSSRTCGMIIGQALRAGFEVKKIGEKLSEIEEFLLEEFKTSSPIFDKNLIELLFLHKSGATLLDWALHLQKNIGENNPLNNDNARLIISTAIKQKFQLDKIDYELTLLSYHGENPNLEHFEFLLFGVGHGHELLRQALTLFTHP